MISRKTLYLLGSCIAIFAASLTGTMVARSQPSSVNRPGVGSPLARWLELDKETSKEVEGLDPRFTEELKSLQEELTGARTALAVLLEDENASNDRIRGQIEDCIAKHNALERRVAQYLLTVRDHLTPAQQKRLFRLCAEGVRKGRGHGWGRGGGRGGDVAGRCKTCGRGGGGGRNHRGQHDDG